MAVQDFIILKCPVIKRLPASVGNILKINFVCERKNIVTQLLPYCTYFHKGRPEVKVVNILNFLYTILLINIIAILRVICIFTVFLT